MELFKFCHGNKPMEKIPRLLQHSKHRAGEVAKQDRPSFQRVEAPEISYLDDSTAC